MKVERVMKHFTLILQKRYRNVFNEKVTKRVWYHQPTGFLLAEFQTATYHEWRHQDHNGRVHGPATLAYWIDQFKHHIPR